METPAHPCMVRAADDARGALCSVPSPHEYSVFSVSPDPKPTTKTPTSQSVAPYPALLGVVAFKIHFSWNSLDFPDFFSMLEPYLLPGFFSHFFFLLSCA